MDVGDPEARSPQALPRAQVSHAPSGFQGCCSAPRLAGLGREWRERERERERTLLGTITIRGWSRARPADSSRARRGHALLSRVCRTSAHSSLDPLKHTTSPIRRRSPRRYASCGSSTSCPPGSRSPSRTLPAFSPIFRGPSRGQGGYMKLCHEYLHLTLASSLSLSLFPHPLPSQRMRTGRDSAHPPYPPHP